MIRSTFRSLVIACAVFGPAELSSQSWLTYRGSVDGRFDANCPTPAGGFAQKGGKLRFNFYNSGNDAKTNFVSEWYPGLVFTNSPRTATGEEKINANGNASGSGIYLLEGGTIRWEGKFHWASDGSAQAAGSILTQAGDTFGCTGTWSAGVATGPAPEPAACAVYRARMKFVVDESLRLAGVVSGDPWGRVRAAREAVFVSSRKIIGIKDGTAFGDLEKEEEYRRRAYAQIKENTAVTQKFEALAREVREIRSQAAAVGCADDGGTDTQQTGADKVVAEILNLDSPKDPVTKSSVETIGVAGVEGDVQIELLGNKAPLRSGTPIPLDQPVTIRTGPGSSVTIQVGSVRKTLQPNSIIRIVPSGNGQPDFIERGGATVDVQKPGAYQMQTPNATASVGNTIFTVSYDATTGVTGVMVEEGRVTVRPKNPAARAVTLAPGEYVEVGRNTMTAVLPAPGAPDTRGGVTSAGPENIDLTGLWRDDTGGGAIYRLRQVGNWLYWLVDGTPKGSYVNLSYGQISGNTITGVWVDMPGSPTLSGGNLILRIESNNRLVKVGASGYGAQAWTRVNGTGGNR